MEKIILAFGIYLALIGFWINTESIISYFLFKIAFIFGGFFLIIYSLDILGIIKII